MDKATDMARRKNLETPGMAPTDLNTAPNIPTVLNTVPSFISHITQCIGVSLGNTPEEIDSTISMIKSLEKTRSDLFLANMRKKNNVEDSDEESNWEVLTLIPLGSLYNVNLRTMKNLEMN